MPEMRVCRGGLEHPLEAQKWPEIFLLKNSGYIVK